MTVARSKIFKTNRSQAVRLPKDVAFPEGITEVEIIKVGNNRVLSPVGKRWDEFFGNGPHFSADFMTDREQPAMQKRKF
ncbi:MAG: type II toxin-antitoxin system VapB family antitoxin [Rhizomicrobium sp.]